MATLQEVDVRETRLLSVPRSAMFKHKHNHRKPDPLMLLVILVSLSLMVTSVVQAAEPVPRTMSLEDLLDGEVMVAPVGRHGAGWHLSYLNNPNLHEQASKNLLNVQPIAHSPTFFLSVQVPW